MSLFSQPYVEMLRRFNPTNIRKDKSSFSAAVQLAHLYTNVLRYKDLSINSKTHYYLKKSVGKKIKATSV